MFQNKDSATAVIAILNLPLNLNITMQFRFWTFLSHVIKTTLSRHPSTERKLSQVSTQNGIPPLHESTK